MNLNTVSFERVQHGWDLDGNPLMATLVNGKMVPDFDFYHLSLDELIEKHGRIASSLARYISRNVRIEGNYVLDLEQRQFFFC